MSSAYDKYFKEDISSLQSALMSVEESQITALIDACEQTIKAGHKIVATGLGKNVPICEKFVGTMLSLGLDANFLHTNTAVHGDMGMLKPGDILIVLTKSGSTTESVYLVDLITKTKPEVHIWLLSFSNNSPLAEKISNKVIVHMDHEGDLWNIVPNHSTTLNLIILQKVAIELSKRFNLTVDDDFKPNHPAGAIGEFLRK